MCHGRRLQLRLDALMAWRRAPPLPLLHDVFLRLFPSHLLLLWVAAEEGKIPGGGLGFASGILELYRGGR